MNTPVLTAFTERMLQTPLLSENMLDWMFVISALLALYFACRLTIARQLILKRAAQSRYGMQVVTYKALRKTKARTQIPVSKLRVVK